MTREEAIELLCAYGVPQNEKRFQEALDMAIEALSVANLKEEFESAVPNCQKCAIKELWEETEKEDLVAVVRCKDCRHHGMRNCPVWGDDTTEDYMWCYYGERREP